VVPKQPVRRSLLYAGPSELVWLDAITSWNHGTLLVIEATVYRAR
jgi:hypothetical protein